MTNKPFWGAYSRVFQDDCLSSLASLLNDKLEFIEISLTFAWDFTLSVLLSFAEFLLIFGT